MLYCAAHGFLAAHGLLAAQGFLAAHGLLAAQGFLAAHGLLAAQGFLAAQVFATNWKAFVFWALHELLSEALQEAYAGVMAKSAVTTLAAITAGLFFNIFFMMIDLNVMD